MLNLSDVSCGAIQRCATCLLLHVSDAECYRFLRAHYFEGCYVFDATCLVGGGGPVHDVAVY